VHNPASPDGTRIGFSSERDHTFWIYVMDADGGNQTDLGRGHQPDWSPDGMRIAYSHQYGNSIYVMDADGSSPAKLAEGIRPAWSSLAQYPDCTSGWTRLQGVSRARVTNDSTTPNRVRSRPSRDAEVVGQLDPGTTVRLIEGPVCADGLVLWRVQHASIPGGTGWTAEGNGQEYWLEPNEP
jgi:hypothetical protein